MFYFLHNIAIYESTNYPVFILMRLPLTNKWLYSRNISLFSRLSFCWNLLALYTMSKTLNFLVLSIVNAGYYTSGQFSFLTTERSATFLLWHTPKLQSVWDINNRTFCWTCRWSLGKFNKTSMSTWDLELTIWY